MGKGKRYEWQEKALTSGMAPAAKPESTIDRVRRRRGTKVAQSVPARGGSVLPPRPLYTLRLQSDSLRVGCAHSAICAPIIH